MTGARTHNDSPPHSNLSVIAFAKTIGVFLGTIGIPTFLYVIGFLAEKGHYSFLNLPTSILRSSQEQRFYDGTLWLIFTLQNLIWHWSFPILLTIVWSLSRIYRHYFHGHRSAVSKRALTLILILVFGIALNSILVRLITIVTSLTSNSISANFHDDLFIRSFWDPLDGPSRRAALYRILSYAFILATWALFWIINQMSVKHHPDRSLIRILIHWIAIILLGLSILSWPVCYGRFLTLVRIFYFIQKALPCNGKVCFLIRKEIYGRFGS